MATAGKVPPTRFAPSVRSGWPSREVRRRRAWASGLSALQRLASRRREG